MAMAIVIAAALLAVGLVVAALLYSRTPGGGRGGAAASAPAPPLVRDEVEAELLERRGEIVRIEERVISKEEAIDVKLAELSRRDDRLDDRDRELDHQRELLEQRKREHLRELERVAGLSAAQAKQVLLKEVEDQARHDAAKVLRQIDEETKLQAERRVRNILSVCMGRLAAAHASETTVSVVQLPSDAPALLLLHDLAFLQDVVVGLLGHGPHEVHGVDLLSPGIAQHFEEPPGQGIQHGESPPAGTLTSRHAPAVSNPVADKRHGEIRQRRDGQLPISLHDGTPVRTDCFDPMRLCCDVQPAALQALAGDRADFT